VYSAVLAKSGDDNKAMHQKIAVKSIKENFGEEFEIEV